MAASEEVTCMDCRRTYTPSFTDDFYQAGNDPTRGRCERCMMSQVFSLPTIADPVPLPVGYKDAVCKSREGAAACSFLAASDGGLRCLKGSHFDAVIRERRSGGQMRAMGDNCSGPSSFTVT